MILELRSADTSLEQQEQRPPKAAEAEPFTGRLRREWKTIELMVGCYCHAHHCASGSLCPECQGLLDYARVRLQRCRFGADKPTCAKCPVHCYQRARRDQVKTVMRYAGLRMLWHHPILSLRHWADSLLHRHCTERD